MLSGQPASPDARTTSSRPEPAPAQQLDVPPQLLQPCGISHLTSRACTSDGGSDCGLGRSASGIDLLLQRIGVPVAPSGGPATGTEFPLSAAAARPAARQPPAVKKVRRREHASLGAEGFRRELLERVSPAASSQPLRLQADARRGRLLLVSGSP